MLADAISPSSASTAAVFVLGSICIGPVYQHRIAKSQVRNVMKPSAWVIEWALSTQKHELWNYVSVKTAAVREETVLEQEGEDLNPRVWSATLSWPQ